MRRPGYSRLLLVASLLSALACAALVALVLRWSESWTTRQIDLEIDAEISALSAFHEQRRALALTDLVRERSNWRPSLGAAYLLTYRSTGERLAGNIRRWPDAAGFDGPFEFTLAGGENGEADLTIRARAVVLNNAFALLVGRSVEPRMALVRDFSRVLPPLAGAIGLLGLGAAFVFGRSMLRRVEDLNATARAVEKGDLAIRAPGADRPDEFGDLARHFNRMLDRLEGLVATTRSTTDRIAHELRTPVTRLRARLDQAASGADETTRARILDAVEETSRLSTLYDALLDISRIEARSGDATGLVPTDLASVIDEVVELYQPVAEDRGIVVETRRDAPVTIAGDRLLLQRLLANLLDNALKFSPDGGVVRGDARIDGEGFVLSVADNGPGMDRDFAARAFEPFSRAAAALGTEGFGLGLAIVRAIVVRHALAISFADNAPGLTVIVSGALRDARR